MARTADPDALKAYAKQVFDAPGRSHDLDHDLSRDRLGLYRALSDDAPRTSADLAAQTGLNERWLREWLAQQGAAGILDFAGTAASR
jgi:hypothetical protein